MGDRLLDKVCIVTGAAQGIGAAYARAMANEGADVAIIDLKRIDQAKVVEDDIKALGRRAMTLKADVTDPDEMTAMGKTVVEEFGHVDCLVNNAALKFDQLTAGRSRSSPAPATGSGARSHSGSRPRALGWP